MFILNSSHVIAVYVCACSDVCMYVCMLYSVVELCCPVEDGYALVCCMMCL
jgi:hypothetical protein